MSYAGSDVYNRFRKGWLNLHDGNAKHMQALQDKDYSALSGQEMRLLLVQFTQLDEDHMSDMDSDDLRMALTEEVSKDVRARLGSPGENAPGVRTRSARRRAASAKQPQSAQASTVAGEEMTDQGYTSGEKGSAESAGPAEPPRGDREARSRQHDSDSTAVDSDEDEQDKGVDQPAAQARVPLAAGAKRKRASRRVVRATAGAVAANAASIAELREQLAAMQQSIAAGFATLSQASAAEVAANAAPAQAQPSSSSERSTSCSSAQKGRRAAKKKGSHESRRAVGKCQKHGEHERDERTPASARSAPPTGGLTRLVRSMLNMAKRRMKSKAISRVTPEKVAEDWAAKQPAAWGGMVGKLTRFKTTERLDKCEPWYERAGADEACLVLPELVQGYVPQIQTQAALARVRRVVRKRKPECVLLPAEPAYIALVCACMSEDHNGHSQYRIVPGQVEELERSRFDPVLLRAAYPLTPGRFEDICIDALALLESMVALGAEALLQQASAIVLLYALAMESASIFGGKEGERALELVLRRVLFEYRVRAVTRVEAHLIGRMGIKAEEYKAWRRSHGSHGASREGPDASTSSKWQYRAATSTGTSREHPQGPTPKSVTKTE